MRALGGVVADVPDLRPWLWGAAVYACPMESGTGIKNKLLEAMAAGAPAVATPLACQGLDGSRRHRSSRTPTRTSRPALVALLRDRARAAAAGATPRAPTCARATTGTRWPRRTYSRALY